MSGFYYKCGIWIAAVYLILILFGTNGVASAQTSTLNIERTHSVNSFAPAETKGKSGTLNVIGIMVEFQPDTTEFTSGTGVFGPGSLPFLESDDITIDPLPHNRAYFKAHLDFIKNYYNRVSGGQLDIEYQLLPGIIQLDRKMEAFSPTGENFGFEKVADLVGSSWAKVEERGGFDATGLDPEETAFVIFHAGVGRDIELTGQTLDRTPQDIPSVYMSKRALQVSLDKPDFEGFSINNGNFRVTNSLVIPRTLSRSGEDIVGNPFVIQLSINGIFAANIGSHLGLPDLFNTETGESGIGRFGLMDGEGFLGFAGLFPPEPSAWEKMRMGWQNPFDIILANNQPIELPAASFHEPGSIARHKVTGDEFFLVENRHRDPEGNGIDVTIRNQNGEVQTVNFTNQDTAFDPTSGQLPDLLPPGVLVEVSNYDWALPGGLDIGDDSQPFTDDDRNLNGGMLIWHIDKAIIEDKIDDLAVNNNPMRRGVDLEEADGAQDIGRALQNIFGTNELGRGSPFDFWWKGNNSFSVTATGDTLRLFENRFGADTRPGNQTNSGGASFFEFFDFSENIPVASFRARKTTPEDINKLSLSIEKLPDTEGSIPPDNKFATSYPPALTPYVTGADTFIIVPAHNKTLAVQLGNAETALFDFQIDNPQQPIIFDNNLVLGNQPSTSADEITITGWQFTNNTWIKSWETIADKNRGFLSSANGDTLQLDFTRQRINPQNGDFFPPLTNAQISTQSIGGTRATLTDSELRSTIVGNNGKISTAPFGSSFRLYPIALETEPNNRGVSLLTDGGVHLVESGGDNFQPIYQSTESVNWPVVTDLNNTGQINFLFVDRATGALEAITRNGSNVSSFPIMPPDGVTFTGSPLLIDIESDGVTDILIPGQDSLSMNIYGFDVDSNKKPNFPLPVGSIISENHQPVNPLLIGNKLFAISPEGDFKGWEFPNADQPVHGFTYGDPARNKPSGVLEGSTGDENFAGIINPEQTYNWPNPANEETFLRFQLEAAGEVDIEIISYSGSLMMKKKMQVSNSAPVEFRIDTASWGSGAYYARIEASVNGNTERKIVKMAIVH